jgi:hypothetical protein
MDMVPSDAQDCLLTWSLPEKVATELVLRRAHTDAVFASILPSQRRTAKQKTMISKFHFQPKKLDRNDFTDLYSAASAHLEEVDRGPGFRYDTLRIEVSGPTQPHLTLIVRSCICGLLCFAQADCLFHRICLG